MSEPNPRSTMNSVLSTLKILEEVAQRQPIGVSELARISSMPKTSVQRSLMTLREAGWLHVVDVDKARWGITSRALTVGLAGAGEERLRDVARPVLEELRDATGETIHLALRDGKSLVILLRQDSPQAVRTFVETGARAPMHATSCGLAILARMSQVDIAPILDSGLERHTATTLVSRSDLLTEIEETRSRGYALNQAAWWRPDVSAIGVAICNTAGNPIAGVAVSIPSSRFDLNKVENFAELANRAADQISAALLRHG